MSQLTTADALVFAPAPDGGGLEILLIQRRFPPFAQYWALPGGFLEAQETPLAACLRELAEETGLRLEGKWAQALTVWDQFRRDPRGAVTSWPYYFVLADQAHHATRAGDDAQQARWFPLCSLPPLAFDHGAIINEALGQFFGLLGEAASGYAPLLPDLLAPPPLPWPSSLTFYGGSFNPFHGGHDACIQEYLRVSEIPLVVIPDHNPWKAQLPDECFFQSLLVLATKIRRPNVYIYPGFWGMQEGNPTINWLAKTPAQNKYLLMGDDSFNNLLSWHRAVELLQILAGIFVIPRGQSAEEFAQQKTKVLALAPHLCVARPGHHAFEEMASCQLRAVIKGGPF